MVPERTSPLTAEPGGQESFGDRGVPVAHQQRPLQRQADVFGDLAGRGTALLSRSRASCCLRAFRCGCPAGRFWPALCAKKSSNSTSIHSGASRHGAQRIQRADIAGAHPKCPSAVPPDRAAACRTLLFGVAVAAQAFPALRRRAGWRACTPVLAGRQASSAQQRRLLVPREGLVGGPGHPHRDDRWRPPRPHHRQVGQHVAHEAAGQSGRRQNALLRVAAAPWWIWRGSARCACCWRCPGAVQAGEVDHLDDGGDATALLADQPRGSAVVFDRSRRR